MVLPEEEGSDQAAMVDWKKLYKSVLSHSEFMPIMSNEKAKGMSCDNDSLIERFRCIIGNLIFVLKSWEWI